MATRRTFLGWLAIVSAAIPSSRILRCTLIYGILGIGCVRPLVGQDQKAIWTVDLKKHGLSGPRGSLGGLFGGVDDPGSAVFVAVSQTAVAIFFDHHTDKASQIIGLFLNPKSGAVIAQKVWMGSLWLSPLSPTAEGNFIVVLNGREHGPPPQLALISPRGDELKKLSLPQHPDPTSERWEILNSSSRKTILLMRKDVNTSDYFLLEADSFKQRSAWSANPTNTRVNAISDENVLWSGTTNGQTIAHFDNSSSQRVLLLTGHDAFLDNESILVLGTNPPGSAYIVTTGGEQLSAFRIPISDPGAGIDLPFVSSDGQRFGTIVYDVGGSGLFRMRRKTAYVWQAQGKQLVLSVPLKYDNAYGQEASLSPDGSVLVVVNALKAFAYKVPNVGTLAGKR